MKKTIKVRCNSESIDKAIEELKNRKKWLEEKTTELVEKLAGRGYQIASVDFKYAEYDGVNDVVLDIRETGNNRIAVIALGDTALFIEFGTGVKYPDDHPYRGTYGMVGRGEYGHGQGKNLEGWKFTGFDNEVTLKSGGEVVGYNSKSDKLVFHTFGNPANKCMYYTTFQLEDEFEEIVRKVFS